MTNIISRRHFNMSTYTRVSLDAPEHETLTPVVPAGLQHKPGALTDSRCASKQLNTRICLLTEQAHVLQQQRERNAQNNNKRSTLSRFLRPPSPTNTLFHSPSLPARWKTTPIACHGCKSTSVQWYCITSASLISQVMKVVVMETGCKPVWSEAVRCREDRYAMKAGAICWRQSLTPSSRVVAGGWHIIRCLCLWHLHLFTLRQWYLMLFNVTGWPGGNSFKYSYLLL